MKKLILAAMAAATLLAAQPAMSLEPWHDYYRQKAHDDKKAKKAKEAREAAMKEGQGAAMKGEKPGEKPAPKEEGKR